MVGSFTNPPKASFRPHQTTGPEHRTVIKPPQKSRKINYSLRSLLVASLIAAGTGAVADHFVESAMRNAVINEAQPACDVPVHMNNNPSIMRSRLAKAGDSGDEARVLVGDSGHTVRTDQPGKPGYTPDYNIQGSMGMQPGDRLEVDHVAEDVCRKVGGTVVKNG